MVERGEPRAGDTEAEWIHFNHAAYWPQVELEIWIMVWSEVDPRAGKTVKGEVVGGGGGCSCISISDGQPNHHGDSDGPASCQRSAATESAGANESGPPTSLAGPNRNKAKKKKKNHSKLTN